MLQMPLTKLKQIWLISSLKISKMSKKCVFGEKLTVVNGLRDTKAFWVIDWYLQ